VNVGFQPIGVAITQDGTKVYVVNSGSNSVSIIDAATNKVTAKVNVGESPMALGQFISGNIQKAKLNGFKAKASLSKHKQKNHSKHHKTGKTSKV
jgi:YVTN family beta-propeller protein